MSIPDLTTKALFSVEGKNALITGGGSGLGLMMAASLIQNGANVIIASRKEEALRKSCEALNALNRGKCYYVKADLGSRKGIDDLIAFTRKTFTKLNILVNNSGVTWGAPFNDFPEREGWDRLFNLNVKSIFYLTQGLTDLLSKDATNIDPGRVIIIASIAGLDPRPEGSALTAPGHGLWSYHVTKAAAIQLGNTLANTLSSNMITVNTIAPGIFPSKMTKFGFDEASKRLLRGQPMGRLGTPEDISGLLLQLVSRAGSHITGTVVPLDGGALNARRGGKSNTDKEVNLPKAKL